MGLSDREIELALKTERYNNFAHLLSKTRVTQKIQGKALEAFHALDRDQKVEVFNGLGREKFIEIIGEEHIPDLFQQWTDPAGDIHYSREAYILSAAGRVVNVGVAAFDAHYPHMRPEERQEIFNEGAAILWNRGNGAGAHELGRPAEAKLVKLTNYPEEIAKLTARLDKPLPHIKLTEPPKLENSKYPDGNPKTQFGVVKPNTFAVDPIAEYVMGLAMLQGQLKYGLYNWIDDPVSITTYLDAAKRHLDLYKLGQDLASDTDVEHLGHVMACCNILISAKYHNKLHDDRTHNKQMAEALEKFFEEKQPLVKQIRDKWTGYAERRKAELEEERRAASVELELDPTEFLKDQEVADRARMEHENSNE
jgi:ribosomal protein S17E